MRDDSMKSLLRSLSSDAPSPKNQEGTARLGEVGFDVTMGAPAAGSVTDPAVVNGADTPPYGSTSHRDDEDCADAGVARSTKAAATTIDAARTARRTR